MAVVFSENFTGFTAAGFAPTPGAGQLDSDVWIVTGLSDNPAPAFGATPTSLDFARGVFAGDPASAGVYASAGTTPTFGTALFYQPTGTEVKTTARSSPASRTPPAGH